MNAYTPTRHRSYLPRRFRISLWPDTAEKRVYVSHIELQKKAAAQTKEQPHWSGVDARKMAEQTAKRLYGQSRI